MSQASAAVFIRCSNPSTSTSNCSPQFICAERLISLYSITLQPRTASRSTACLHYTCTVTFIFRQPSLTIACVVASYLLSYLQPVFRQGLGSFHDDLLNPLHRQVTSGLLQTLTEESYHLKFTKQETDRNLLILQMDKRGNHIVLQRRIWQCFLHQGFYQLCF